MIAKATESADLWNDRLFVAGARSIPILTTMVGSGIALLPVVAVLPVLPPFGLLILLGWRLLRPELWPAWVALPLGLFDDLISGQPLGSAMATWTICFFALDYFDHRLIWRDYWIDWLVASLAIAFCSWGSWAAVKLTGGGGDVLATLPQIILSVCFFLAIVRLCAGIDRWRLRR